MLKKSFVVILILSVVATYGIAILDNLMRGSLVSGKGGFPLKFASGPSTDGTMLILDIAFWFAIIWGIWKILQKTLKKKK